MFPFRFLVFSNLNQSNWNSFRFILERKPFHRSPLSCNMLKDRNPYENGSNWILGCHIKTLFLVFSHKCKMWRRKRRSQQFFDCCLHIRCRCDVFTESLSSNDRAYASRLKDWWEGFMVYAVEMGWSAKIYIPSFMKIGSAIKKLGGTQAQRGELISLLLFFSRNKENRLILIFYFIMYPDLNSVTQLILQHLFIIRWM
jgi:hypothetical protein